MNSSDEAAADEIRPRLAHALTHVQKRARTDGQTSEIKGPGAAGGAVVAPLCCVSTALIGIHFDASVN